MAWLAPQITLGVGQRQRWGLTMADFNCRHCGKLIHLGKCGEQPADPKPTYAIAYVGGYVVKLNGVTVAVGFDNRAEAQDWIDSQ